MILEIWCCVMEEAAALLNKLSFMTTSREEVGDQFLHFKDFHGTALDLSSLNGNYLGKKASYIILFSF